MDNWAFQYPLKDVVAVQSYPASLKVANFIFPFNNWDTDKLARFVHSHIVKHISLIFLFHRLVFWISLFGVLPQMGSFQLKLELY